jgi:hypothetical protein
MRGHLPWEDGLFRDAQALWDGARALCHPFLQTMVARAVP